MSSLIRKKNVQLTPVRVKEFLKQLEKTGNLLASAAAIDVKPGTIYAAIKRDKRFGDAVELARHKAAHAIESELRRRGIEGYEEKVFHNGEEVGTKTRYSDRLLEMLAKGNMPEKYGNVDQAPGITINLGDSVKSKLANMLGVEIKKDEDIIEGEFSSANE
jgi:hypothetical protein